MKVKVCLKLKSKTNTFQIQCDVYHDMQMVLIHFPFVLSFSLCFLYYFVQKNFF